MYRLIILSLLAFILSACISSQPMLFKPGVSLAKKQSDLDMCNIASFKEVPQTMVTEISGGYYDPGFLQCRGDRHGHSYCFREGGYYVSPSSYTYDRNNGIRQRYINSCLNKKGYSILKLPRCKTDAESMNALQEKNPSLLKCNPDPALAD